MESSKVNDWELNQIIIIIKEMLNLFSNQNQSLTISHNNSDGNCNSGENTSKDDDLQIQLISDKFDNLLKYVKSNVNLFKKSLLYIGG